MALWHGKKNSGAGRRDKNAGSRPFDDFFYDDMQDMSGSYQSFSFRDEAREETAKPAEEDSPFLEDHTSGVFSVGGEASSTIPPDSIIHSKAENKTAASDDFGYPDSDIVEGTDDTDDFGYPVENDTEPQTPEQAISELKMSREAEESENGSNLVRRIRDRRRKDSGEDDNPASAKKKDYAPAPKGLRRFGTVVITLLLAFVLFTMVFSHIVTDGPLGHLLTLPESGVANVVTPVQSFFSSVTGSVVNYLRTLKLRSAIETEYNALRAENETLVYQAMLADELQIRLQQYENMNDEVQANTEMKPLICTVIGRDDSNYFSTFTINKGQRDGIENYMAVTSNGALVGYTEDVKESSATVRTIIDSDASIAALIQSSRDQGIVSGTLGIDGTKLCRMYYLSEEKLPRPGDVVVTSGVGMSFPKGIPIGTVRESTRGMESNKQFIVVEPKADFSHIEYVIVLRYQPTAEAVTGRNTTDYSSNFVPLETARPYPTLRIGGTNMFVTPTPEPDEEAPTPAMTDTPTPSPSPTPSPTPYVTATPDSSIPVYEYHAVDSDATPTPEPTPTPSPSPTPYVTLHPDQMTWEED